MTSEAARARLTHEAALYHGDGEYAKVFGPVIRSGLALDGAVLVVAPSERLDQLNDALGTAAASVDFLDMTVVGRNPTAIIPTVLLPYADRHRDRRVTIIGEPIWPGRSEAAYATAVQNESLINLALADHDVTIICAYDVEALPATAVDDAYRTHPIVMSTRARSRSSTYLAPPELAPTCLRPWPAPPSDAATVDFHGGNLRRVRRYVGEVAEMAGLPAERVNDLRVAVNEVVTNVVRHGGGSGLVRTWCSPASLTCEVADRGRMADLLAGRRPADLGAEHGRGLLLANQLCDLLQIDSDRDGTTVRLHFDRT